MNTHQFISGLKQVCLVTSATALIATSASATSHGRTTDNSIRKATTLHKLATRHTGTVTWQTSAVELHAYTTAAHLEATRDIHTHDSNTVAQHDLEGALHDETTVAQTTTGLHSTQNVSGQTGRIHTGIATAHTITTGAITTHEGVSAATGTELALHSNNLTLTRERTTHYAHSTT